MSTVKRRKYQYCTRQEAEDAAKHLETRRHVLDICMNELLRGNVRWFEIKGWRIGLIRPGSATGGYATVQATNRGRPMPEWVDAWYFDDLERDRGPGWASHFGPDDPAHALVVLIAEVRRERDRLAGEPVEGPIPGNGRAQ